MSRLFHAQQVDTVDTWVSSTRLAVLNVMKMLDVMLLLVYVEQDTIALLVRLLQFSMNVVEQMSTVPLALRSLLRSHLATILLD